MCRPVDYTGLVIEEHMYNTQGTFRLRHMLLVHAIKFHPCKPFVNQSDALGLDQRRYSMSGPVNSWMGDRLRVNHLGITSHLGQLSLSSFRGR